MTDSLMHEFTVTPGRVVRVHPTDDQALLAIFQATGPYFEYRVKMEVEASQREPPPPSVCLHDRVTRRTDYDGDRWSCDSCGKDFTP